MPLAGRLADVWGARRLFLCGLVVFTVGSFLAGRAQSLEELIAGPRRPGARRRSARAGRRPPRRRTCSRVARGRGRSGVIGALTFLGMAAGPFAGAAILGSFHPDARSAAMRACRRHRCIGRRDRPGLALGLLRQRPDRDRRRSSSAWAASAGWETPRRRGRIDVLGAVLFSVALAAALGGADAARRHRSAAGRPSTPATADRRAARCVAVVGTAPGRSSVASGAPTRSSTRGCSEARASPRRRSCRC